VVISLFPHSPGCLPLRWRAHRGHPLAARGVMLLVLLVALGLCAALPQGSSICGGRSGSWAHGGISPSHLAAGLALRSFPATPFRGRVSRGLLRPRRPFVASSAVLAAWVAVSPCHLQRGHGHRVGEHRLDACQRPCSALGPENEWEPVWAPFLPSLSTASGGLGNSSAYSLVAIMAVFARGCCLWRWNRWPHVHQCWQCLPSPPRCSPRPIPRSPTWAQSHGDPPGFFTAATVYGLTASPRRCRACGDRSAPGLKAHG